MTNHGARASAGGRPQPVPPPLHVAVGLTWLEAFVLVVQGLSLVPSLDGQRVAMGSTTIVFFVLYGVGLAWCAWKLRQGESWARSPVVFAQLIQLGVASSFWGGATSYVTVALVLVALIVIAGIFHPQSLHALDHD